jgi:hypothetical protein
VKPRVRAVFYLVPILLGILATVVLTWWGLTDRAVRELLAVSWAPSLLAVAALLVLVYRSWSCLPREEARMSPGTAVGLLFVPVFNLFWMFQVWYGFAVDYNRTLRARQYPLHPLPGWLYLSFCVGALLSLVPVVNFVVVPFQLALLILVVVVTCRAVNTLAAAEAASGHYTEAELAAHAARSVGPLYLAGGVLLLLVGLAALALFLLEVNELRTQGRRYEYAQRKMAELDPLIGELEKKPDPASKEQLRLARGSRDSLKWASPPRYSDLLYWLPLAGVGVVAPLLGAWFFVLARRKYKASTCHPATPVREKL